MPALSLTLSGTHHADDTSPGGTRAVVDRLRTDGIATVGGLDSRTKVLAFAGQVMTLVPHRDSDADGLTTIQDIGRRSLRPGLGGLGAGELPAHTERSSVPWPPRLMLLVCQRPADRGGEVLLTDGRAVHAHLAEHAPEALEALALAGTAFYGDGGGHTAQIFTRHPDGRISVRLRQDALAQFSPLVRRHLPDLTRAIGTVQRRVLLGAGQGYLIDNHRWLHARTAFTGRRVCLRALGASRAPLPAGFAPRPPGQTGAERPDRERGTC
ncbi:TauD/TfdA family dioxygenase [Streptomyces jumonjinensis]|uniref:TauD/TfdA family dioxygenase n=1 Tax=Streptomyces jumonjinensis TaxID=1945 RepID=UPI0037B7DC11